MLPDWFTKPESLFRTVLWLLGPLFTWLVGKAVIRRVEDWHAVRTLAVARINLKYYRQRLENPPSLSLFEQVALIVCILPAPITLTFLMLLIQNSPSWIPHPKHPETFQLLRTTVYFINYLLFGILSFFGVQAAYRLRHGEGKYAENYRAEVQKKIEKLLKKFPQLRDVAPKPELIP
jgi:hypothetical protein